jgi:hypothetical protein
MAAFSLIITNPWIWLDRGGQLQVPIAFAQSKESCRDTRAGLYVIGFDTRIS